MKVIVIKDSKPDELTRGYVHCIENLADSAFRNAVVNTSYVGNDEVFDLLLDSYYEDDYDVFITTVDFITSKQQSILDGVKRCDLLYATLLGTPLGIILDFLEN